MDFSHIYKISGTGLLAVSLVIVPFDASTKAQVDEKPEIEIVETEDDGFDWGWLGLLGLLGLAGLSGLGGKNDRQEKIQTEPFPEAPARPANNRDR